MATAKAATALEASKSKGIRALPAAKASALVGKEAETMSMQDMEGALERAAEMRAMAKQKAEAARAEAVLATVGFGVEAVAVMARVMAVQVEVRQ